jgi:hypothetical protein
VFVLFNTPERTPGTQDNRRYLCLSVAGSSGWISEAAAANFTATSAGQKCVLLETFDSSRDQLHVANNTVRVKRMIGTVEFGAGGAGS